MQNENNTKDKNYNITIYTDGACSGNPGKGGWGAILMCDYIDKNGKKSQLKKIISGGEKYTTNNKMELTAIIKALEAIKKPSQINIFTDSKYVLEGFTKWLPTWQKNNWKCANKKPVKNADLWQLLYKFSLPHKINWNWVKGHSTNTLNIEVDAIAVAESNKQ